MNRIFGVALLCIVTCGAFSQVVSRAQNNSDELLVWEPQPLLKIHAYPPATVPKPMITSLHISNFAIVLEETKLEAAESRFGGQIGSSGDAGDALGWLCLQGSDSAGRWVLWLESDEIDGPYVGSFQWRRVAANVQFDRRCQVLGNVDNEVALPIKLRLGSSESQVLQILGKPTFRKGNTLFYEHEHNRTIRNEPWTSTNTVIIVLRHGVIWALDVDQSTRS